MKKTLSKIDIFFGVIYFLSIILYCTLIKTVLKSSAEINLFVVLAYIAVAAIYRQARNKGTIRICSIS